MFVISLIQFGRFVKFFRRGRDSSFFSAFVDVLVCILMCIFVFIAALFVSLGFGVWCGEMTKRFEQCSKLKTVLQYQTLLPHVIYEFH